MAEDPKPTLEGKMKTGKGLHRTPIRMSIRIENFHVSSSLLGLQLDSNWTPIAALLSHLRGGGGHHALQQNQLQRVSKLADPVIIK